MTWADIVGLVNAHGPLTAALVLSLAANVYLIRTILGIQDERLKDNRDLWKAENAREQLMQKMLTLLEWISQDARAKK